MRPGGLVVKLNRFVLVSLVALCGITAMFSSGADAASAPTCKGKKATHWLSVPGGLTVEDDTGVVIGSTGNDIISVNGANPLVRAGAGPDSVTLNDGGTACLGSGNDSGMFSGGAVAHGESGADNFIAHGSMINSYSEYGLLIAGTGSTAVGGSGNDTISSFGSLGI